MNVGRRLYAGLLRVYPAEFRDRFAHEMVVLFGDQLREAGSRRGRVGVAATWIRSLIDLAANAIEERLRRDRARGTSSRAFDPTRSSRLLGLVGTAGGTVLLWAFLSSNPFDDKVTNSIRLAMFWLGAIAISGALYPRLSAFGLRFTAFTTAAVFVGAVWNLVWSGFALVQEQPWVGPFGGIGFAAGCAGWAAACVYGLTILRSGGAWATMARPVQVGTRFAGGLLVLGGPLTILGLNNLQLNRWANYSGIVSDLGAAGVAMAGLGWLTLGALLLMDGARAAPPLAKTLHT